MVFEGLICGYREGVFCLDGEVGKVSGEGEGGERGACVEVMLILAAKERLKRVKATEDRPWHQR